MLRWSAFIGLAAAVVTLAACGAHKELAASAGTPAELSGVYGIAVVMTPPSVSVILSFSPPRLPGGFGLSGGRVPITEAHLVVRALGSGRRVRTVTTGDDGVFEVALPPGRYEFTLTDPPFGGMMAREGQLYRAMVRKYRPAYRTKVTVRPSEYTRVVIGPSPFPSEVVSGQ